MKDLRDLKGLTKHDVNYRPTETSSLAHLCNSGLFGGRDVSKLVTCKRSKCFTCHTVEFEGFVGWDFRTLRDQTCTT